ncbi:hypothetical protein TTHERM_00757750 (macronuclear) [Tetrahymena thermophila SB210]|uniref:Transmembrane protein n=1 Tax=Tetrahymena thermophila (strain SB210) TaxID=312017 RepID=Q23JN1_TETTS|nr:hypothetical protein TTHERM_00757750 [Tetrahymena thermophila SB210]EAR96712.2 hypothetical protein TTHERM_00757750 [Tetrahymena thermophila SB210]|eukprot:XP_001016957.2 hypothetical protein TTHERM_00757750 [Tetrahymena thermophila SB210]
MVPKQIFFLITSIIVLIKSEGCGLGCQICQQDQCTLCLQNFELDTSLGLCVYKSCEQNFYFQPNLDLNYSNGKCQSLCDLSYIGNTIQNICVQIAQCSVADEISQNIPYDQELLDVQIYKKNFYSIIYNQQIQLFSIDDLEFYSNQKLQNGDLKAFNVNGTILLQSTDNSISVWDLTLDKRTLLIDSQTHMIGQNSYFNFVKSNILFVLSYNIGNDTVVAYLVDMSNFQLYEFQVQLSQSIVSLTILQTFIVIHNKQGIQIVQYNIDFQKIEVEFYQQQNGNQCIQFNSTQVNTVIQIQGKLFIALEDNLLVYNLNQQSCQSLQLDITQFTQIEGSNSNLLILSNQTLYMISNLDQQNLVISKMCENILDFSIVSLPNNTLEILALLGNSTLQIYQLTDLQSSFQLIYSELLIDYNFETIIILSNIQQYQNANNNQIYQFSLVGRFVQILKRDSMQNTINSQIIGNYQQPFPTPNSQAVQIAILYSYMQLVSCHSNGDIIFYDISAAQYAELMLKLNLANSGCIDMITFLDQNLIVQMQDRILIIQGKDWTILQEIAINQQTQNVLITSNNDQLAIILDSCMKILDDHLAYIYDGCQNEFLGQLQQIIIVKNNIYIQTPSSLESINLIFYVFQILLE